MKFGSARNLRSTKRSARVLRPSSAHRLPGSEALLPKLDAYAWSFEVGAVKPEPRMYAHLCEALDARPEQVVMIGDILSADYEGPIAYGMQACHLARKNISAAKAQISTLAHLQRFVPAT
ncbi:HAD family hydrolase [Variovorax arabinosiphilus]|uniref:HAD family hydrolase n=1 Tax=Variovorax arabinosiphilus TaxID=3053498 RepID=UPI00336553A9